VFRLLLEFCNVFRLLLECFNVFRLLLEWFNVFRLFLECCNVFRLSVSVFKAVPRSIENRAIFRAPSVRFRKWHLSAVCL
jgi:hypothetical protein